MAKQQLADLSKVEWDLMNVIWRRMRVTVGDVHTLFLDERGWSYTTVRTMMERLVTKGYLESDDTQLAHIYKPAVPRARTVRKALAETLDRMLDDNLSPLVAYASRRRGLSEKDLEALKKILEGGD